MRSARPPARPAEGSLRSVHGDAAETALRRLASDAVKAVTGKGEMHPPAAGGAVMRAIGSAAAR